ncbi:flagellar motor protein MotB [Burkholderia plantarii]|uniref:flagellar motor protein MotB n=1 Tax=Burkholderia plantarii TaxID=41899 RepID=UPI0018DC8138|nr:flagellar motor protein MotB [Burkholderia plantarii]MBI0328464.1 flagellar motor protein MotB [Burkholderia plantarii]
MATDKAAEQAARRMGGGGTTIVRRVKRDAHEGHHGGAWKIAYADFVTAMMAFFLLMWLLGSTSKYDRQGIESYFNTPLSALLGSRPDSNGVARASVIDGGGHDLSDTHGGNGNAAPQAASGTPRDAANDARLVLLKQQLTALVDENPKLKAFKNQIRLSTTREGLRIEIVDSRSRPMFATGSARLEDYAYDILFQIGGVLNQVDNRVSLAGHTDAVPYSGGIAGYSNWELSSERANAARRALVAGDLREDKLLQVRGLADVLPLEHGEAGAEVNRRISILVLNREAERAFFADAGETPAALSRAAAATPSR